MEDELEPAGGAEGQAETAVPEEPEKEPDWKALSRKWEARAKANAEKAKAYDEIRQSQMSDAEKLREAETKLAELELERDRARWADELADETGVPAKVLRMVGASTRDELEEKAKAVAEAMPKAAPSMPVVGSDGGHATFDGPATASDFLRQSFYNRNR